MSAATRVDLLRHGVLVGGRRLRGSATDDLLSPRGWADMERVARHEGPWDTIVSSPMQRCHVFARATGAALDIPVAADERFAEYDFGDWSGREVDALWAEQGDALATFFADPDSQTPPGGEDAASFRARVRAGWVDLLAHGAGRRVLLVSHGGVLRQLLADALGMTGPIFTSLEWPHAALTRLRAFDDPVHGHTATLVFHARTHARTGAPGEP